MHLWTVSIIQLDIHVGMMDENEMCIINTWSNKIIIVNINNNNEKCALPILLLLSSVSHCVFLSLYTCVYKLQNHEDLERAWGSSVSQQMKKINIVGVLSNLPQTINQKNRSTNQLQNTL